MLEAPRLPLVVRTANALTGPFARALPQLSLAPERLLAEASRRSGLSDFGDDDAWRSGLASLCASAEAEAALTPLGRSIARNSLLGALENRLRMTDWRRRHPEVDAERIERPVIVIGIGRTGTTILHDLLARDPRNRVPLTWEVDRPVPPPETATSGHCHPRVVEAIREQAGKLIHAQVNIIYHEPLLELVDELRRIVHPSLDGFFFSTSVPKPSREQSSWHGRRPEGRT